MLPVLRGDAGRRRGGLPPGRRHALRGDHRVPARRRALPGAVARALRPLRAGDPRASLLRGRGRCATWSTSTTTSASSSCLFDGVAEPVDGALQPDLSRPGNGLELERADAERYATKEQPMCIASRCADALGNLRAGRMQQTLAAAAAAERAAAGVRDLPRALQGLVRRQLDVDADRPHAAAYRGGRRRPCSPSGRRARCSRPSRRSTPRTDWSASSRTCAGCTASPAAAQADVQPGDGPAAARARARSC